MSASGALDLPKLVALVKARAALLIGITLAATTLALIVSLSQPERYKATAVLLFGGTPQAEMLVEGGAPEEGDPEQTTATNIALASLDTVVSRVKRRLGTPASLEELKDAVDIEAQGQSALVDLTAEWDTADGAALLATTFAEEVVGLRRQLAQAEIQRAIDALRQTIEAAGTSGGEVTAGSSELASLRRRVSQLVVLKAVETGDVRLAERATPPAGASSPRPLLNTVAAGVLALLLGVGAVVMLAGFDTRIRDESEIAAVIGAPVLARIPEVARPRRFLPLGGRHEDSSFLEAIQFLRLNVQRMNPRGAGVVVAVTSPTAGDGKTMVVAWLAQSLALDDAEVLAVDYDLRNPMLHTYFDAGDELGGLLPNLRLLRARDHAALSLGLTTHEPLRDLLDGARDKPDYVVVDTSPVARVAHASAVAGAADGVILVVDRGTIRRKDLLAAKEQLANARANVIGIVVNRAEVELHGYYAAQEPLPDTDVASHP